MSVHRGSTVRLVVDPAFGERLASLPLVGPIWVMDSPQNTPVAHRLWHASRPGDDLDLTTFKPGEGLAADEEAIRKLDDIEDHHAGYSQDPPYSVLEIIGCGASEQLVQALADFGFRCDFSDSYTVRAVRTEGILPVDEAGL